MKHRRRISSPRLPFGTLASPGFPQVEENPQEMLHAIGMALQSLKPDPWSISVMRRLLDDHGHNEIHTRSGLCSDALGNLRNYERQLKRFLLSPGLSRWDNSSMEASREKDGEDTETLSSVPLPLPSVEKQAGLLLVECRYLSGLWTTQLETLERIIQAQTGSNLQCSPAGRTHSGHS
jgi:hypothetical protein